jgi:hypothetical protein
MLALIEEARLRQRRRRAGLALIALVLAGVGAAGFLSTRHGGSSAHSSGTAPVETLASGMVIRARSAVGRLVAPAMVAAATAQALHRGQRLTTAVELDPKTGAVVVRLTTSH